VLRSNCIDCLDRTNVAQFAFGLVALGRQLEALGVADAPRLDPRSSIAAQLVDLYEAAGNTLARQVISAEGSPMSLAAAWPLGACGILINTDCALTVSPISCA